MPKASKRPSSAVRANYEEKKARHEHFANVIMEGASPSDAARAVGLHPSQATSIMRNEEVQMILHEARTQLTDMSTIKRIDVLNMFLDAVEMARLQADPAQMINGADKIAKYLNFYEPERIEITHSLDPNVLSKKLKAMSDEELYALAAQKAKTVDGEVIQ